MARPPTPAARTANRFALLTARRPISVALLQTALVAVIIFGRLFLYEAMGYRFRPGVEHRWWIAVAIGIPVSFAVFCATNLFLRRARKRQAAAG